MGTPIIMGTHLCRPLSIRHAAIFHPPCVPMKSDISFSKIDHLGTHPTIHGNTFFDHGNKYGNTYWWISAERTRQEKNKKPAITRAYGLFAE
jgi:hypothetical protein